MLVFLASVCVISDILFRLLLSACYMPFVPEMKAACILCSVYNDNDKFVNDC